MKQKSKWPDFLFTLTVRFICGIIFGSLAGLLFVRRILRSFAHENIRGPYIWLAICGLIGGIAAVFTIPYWLRPWYKGINDRDD